MSSVNSTSSDPFSRLSVTTVITELSMRAIGCGAIAFVRLNLKTLLTPVQGHR
jgi:hypothetical protein